MMPCVFSFQTRFILNDCYLYIYIFYGVITYKLQLSQCPSVVNTFETYISHTCDFMVLHQI